MRTIIYTQRVELVKSYGERRDCADQRIPQFLSACGYLPVPVPNVPEILGDFVERLHPDGIFFTGGNSLVRHGGDAPERDRSERILTEWGISRKIPVFGICRGMQFLGDFFGGEIRPVESHVATRHALEGRISRDSVNSYHTLALWDAPEELDIFARAGDGSIEAFHHRSHAVMAIGWHPEREERFLEEDMELVRGFFG